MYYYFLTDFRNNSINTNIIYNITTIFLHKYGGDDVIKLLKRESILMAGVMVLALAFCGAVAAHPGHGTPIEEPSDPGTGSGTDTGSTETGTTGSSGTGTTSSASASTGSGYSGYVNTYGGSQSAQTGTTDTQANAADNTGTQTTGNSPEAVIDYSSLSDSPGGPAALIGLMVVIGLIAMSFPYKEGGYLNRLQVRLFS